MRLLLSLLIFVSLTYSASRHPATFDSAKEYSERLVLSEMDNYTIKALYSQIPLKYTYKISIPTFPGKPQVDIILIPMEDIYESSTYESRSHTIEWEHVVPAYWFRTVSEDIRNAWDIGHPKCVTSTGRVYKGRTCAQKVSPLFREMESDLYNLEPALGSLNAIRRDYGFGMIDGEARPYGVLIDFEIDRDKNIIEPTDNIRGKVARIMIYMNNKFSVQFPDHNNTMELMKQWDTQYPMSPWEIRKREILKNTYGYKF
jgi:endonuclease I